MGLRSKTGLIEGVRKPVKRQNQPSNLDFPNFARPAPYTLRPFAGVYNPFPYGCSILCNHPADYEAKDVVKRAKDSWATEGRALLMPEEMAAIRVGLLQSSHPVPYEDGEDAVPEELFRRYTETDSRPLTPAPTLASVITRGSGRRCVTPDPVPTHCFNPTRERTLLVLDLRRSHSQDTLSWQAANMPTATSIQPSTRNNSPVQVPQNSPTTQKKKTIPKKKGGVSPKPDDHDKGASQKLQQQVMQGVKTLPVPIDNLDIMSDTGGSGDEEITKRRGKHRRRRKKSGRDGSREPEKEFQGLPEPGETQVSAMGIESRNTSTRPSLISGPVPGEVEVAETQQVPVPVIEAHRLSQVKEKSFIDEAILKQLQRELNQEVIDGEFNPKRHRALEEALKSRPEKLPPISDEMKRLKREMRLPPSNNEQLLTLPRNFTRQSSRFELPLDSRLLNTMTPMQYIQSYVCISSGRRLLYNRVFNRHREEWDEEEETDRHLLGKNVIPALEEVMGRHLTEDQCKYIRDLIGWEDSQMLDFRTWGGLCAVCERLLAPQFISSLPSRVLDPCHEVEQADFESLPKKLQGLNPDPHLVTILNGIREL